MHPPVDTSGFQIPYGDEDPEEQELIDALAKEARAYVESFPWAPPITELLLAFGLGKVLGLFLVRFERPLEGAGEGEGDNELWIVVGDLAAMYFATDARTPAEALDLYAIIADDWADTILADADISDCFPVAAPPTHENAELLKRRTAVIREKFIPRAGNPSWWVGDEAPE